MRKRILSPERRRLCRPWRGSCGCCGGGGAVVVIDGVGFGARGTGWGCALRWASHRPAQGEPRGGGSSLAGTPRHRGSERGSPIDDRPGLPGQ